MIEVTCAACGTVNRIADVDVPVGAKFTACSSCKARIPIGRSGTTAPPPNVPRAAPPIPVPVPAAARQNQVIDLADLPAPKRSSALGPEPSKPAPRSGLAAARDEPADLPAPKLPLKGVPEIPRRPLSPKPEIADLPSPKSPSTTRTPKLGDLPPRTQPAGFGDLPPPRAQPAGFGDLPAPRAQPAGFGDLPAPRAQPASFGDLPAPRAPAGVADLPAPKHPSGFADLLAPKTGPDDVSARRAAVGDLPTPRSPASGDPARRAGLGDLPTPKSPLADRSRNQGLGDLPTPPLGDAARKAQPAGQGDLPVPKSPVSDRTRNQAASLGDLPAPRSPLAGKAQPPGRPQPPAFGDLPAPKARPLGYGDLPAPKAQPLGSGDLPGSRSQSISVGDLPAGPATKQGLGDVPANRQSGPPTKQGLGDPANRSQPIGFGDLPGPRSQSISIGDLPGDELTPRADLLTPRADLLTPRADLLTPKHQPGQASFDDLPTPRPGAPGLLTPKNPPARGGDVDDSWGGATLDDDEDITDLLAPKSVAGIDLPMPSTPRHVAEAAQVKQTQDIRGPNADVPAPKGFFDDLPQPARGGSGLPAPLGFFDDLPQAKSPNAQPSNLPAPLGFFDDLPQAKPGGGPQPPAPKGFFDDLPQAKSTDRKSFYDDLPQDAPIDISQPKGFFDDLPQPSRGKPESLKLEIAVQPEETHAPHLDLESPPTPPEPVAVRIATPTIPPLAPPHIDEPLGLAPTRDVDIELKLEGEARSPIATPKLEPKRAKRDRLVTQKRASGSRSKLMLVLLVIVALAGGGYWFYQRRVAAAERAETIDKELTTARSALAAADPAHWQRASTAVQHVLELAPDNGDALAIGAEAALAGVLDTGTGGPMKLGAGRRMLADAIAAGAKGPQVSRAQALGAIAANQPDKAVEMLKPLVAQSPKDPFLALYMGWAQAGANASADAVKSFDIAMAVPATKTSALYARGRAKLAAGDLEGARADFTSLLETAKDHIGAQVGLAAALPASQAPQRESDLLAILARKDISSGDPRAVALAWSLAADDARRAGRFDSARERYRKALALQEKDPGALTGLADVELRDGKLDAAAEMIGKATVASPTYVPALTVAAEIATAQNKLEDAAKTLDDLAARTNLAPLDAARVKLAVGKLREAQGQEDAALDAYVESAKLAGDLDLAPRMAAVTKLMTAAHKAADAKDGTRAAELRERGDQLLGGLVDSAQRDPAVAMTLGVAYLEANDPTKAEMWLRRVVEARPDDTGARFQLAKVVARLGRIDEALDGLKRALDKEPGRMEIALELARTYESAGRNDEAVAAYDKLLASPDVGLELRGYAGRFFIKLGQIAKGAAQGDEIAKLEPFNPVGMYLRAEGQFAAGNVEDAAKLFKRAADAEPDPVFLDGWGRAAEAQAIQSNDMRFQDVALRAYTQAHDAAPTMFGPLVGLGRIYLARHEAAKAVMPLLDASKIKPNDPDVAFGVGAAYQELQQKSAAIKWLELAAREKPRAETRWRLGQLYYDGQHDREASSNLAAAVKLANDDEKAGGKKVEWMTDALYDLGSIYLALHNDAGARDAWNQYLARNPKNVAQVNEVKYKLATELRR